MITPIPAKIVGSGLLGVVVQFEFHRAGKEFLAA